MHAKLVRPTVTKSYAPLSFLISHLKLALGHLENPIENHHVLCSFQQKYQKPKTVQTLHFELTASIATTTKSKACSTCHIILCMKFL